MMAKSQKIPSVKLRCLAHEVLPVADDRQREVDERGGLEEEDNLVGIGRPRDADEVWPDDSAEASRRAHAEGPGSVDLGARHGQHRPVEDCGSIGRGVEGEDERPEEQRIEDQPIPAEGLPDGQVKAERKRVDGEELYEKRRPAEEVDIGATEAREQRVAQCGAESQKHGEAEADGDRDRGEIEVEQGRDRKCGNLVPEGDERVHASAASVMVTPRLARRVRAAKIFSEMKVRMR